MAAIATRYPAVQLVIAETRVQGPGAGRDRRALAGSPRIATLDVVILARGGGSFEDLLPFSDEGSSVGRRLAVPVVSAVGHEQDSRSATSRRTCAPDADRGRAPRRPRPRRARAGLGRAKPAARGRHVRALERDRARLERQGAARLAPRLLLERRRVALDRSAARLQALSPRATLARGYAIVRAGGAVVRDAGTVTAGGLVEIELAWGLGARVEEVRP